MHMHTMSMLAHDCCADHPAPESIQASGRRRAAMNAVLHVRVASVRADERA